MSAQLTPEAHHPLDNLTSRGWAGGLLRLAAAAALLALVLAFTDRQTWDLLLQVENLPFFAAGAALTALQRVLRVVKWAAMIQGLPLLQRPVAWLLRVQLIGMLINLVIPVSEALKTWAVSRDRRDVALAAESILLDTALLSVVVGIIGLGAGLLMPIGALGWLPWLVLGLTALSVAVSALIRHRPRPTGAVLRISPTTLALSTLEALCILGVFALALNAIGAAASPLFLAAIFPLLYLSHLVMLTPSGIGVREAVFAAVFGALSDTPAEAAVAMGLFISAMQLLVAVAGGGLAVLLPGRRLTPDP